MDDKRTQDSANDRSGPGDTKGMLPSISLPKGGGAIADIGEKFRSNPVTGTGALTVPIFTTPSRSDFHPKLSLNYDSGSSNGPFGLGWNLSVPSITRKTQKGLPQYADADESDIFIISDAEDLIPALIQDAGVWQQDIFPASLNSQAYTVRRYRPRVEGSFVRIEKWTNTATGSSFWKSVTRDSITSLFGLTAASQIANTQNASQVFEWRLDRSYDSHGNVVVYEYKSENSDNVVSTVYEASRSVTANRYLKQILYGNQTPYFPDDTAQTAVPLPLSWCFHALFDYGEHDLITPTPTETALWNVRSDPFSDYRATFEVRTYRLCQRILMFHQFSELGTKPCLVRSTDFTYTPNPTGTYLTSVAQTGYIRNPSDQTYKVVDSATSATLSPLSMPALELVYSTLQIDQTLHIVNAESLENVPDGVDGKSYRWIDLENDGLTGILSEQAGNWFYKRNISNLPRDSKGQIVPDDSATSGTITATFESLRTISPKPSLATLSFGRQQLLDLAGDGRKCLVQYDEPVSGFYEQGAQNDWLPFTPFHSKPNIDWKDPNLRFIDLDGDGHADVLITENDIFTWYQSRAKEGFGAARHVAKPFDEDRGPALIFADGTESIYLADFSGDGLPDMVRIRNGEVCYWPNLGYGRFGAKITMDGAPIFDLPDQFEYARIRLADIDGSGTTDLLYLGRDKTTFWFNQSGNGWSVPQELPAFPAIADVDSVAVMDLLGNGTACVVWSSPLPGNSSRSMGYIDLMGGKKPHLLISVNNHLGAETQIEYASSTHFYLQDRFAGQPWITKLPFPVQVVKSVQTIDSISLTQFVSRYAYHHGYYDGIEREYRGFGMVEQFDTVSYSKYSGTGVFSQTPEAVGEEYYLPPVHTKTWYHTGAFFALGKVARHCEAEYYQGDPLLTPLPDTALPGGLTGDEVREACRALKGKILRSEVYADDGSPQAGEPYSVSESACQIRLLQPRLHQKYASFYSFESESIACHYERNPSDPRIAHSMNLEVDEFGNVTKSVAMGYPRRPQGSPLPIEQTKLLITYTENDVTNVADQLNWYRLGIPVETRTFELNGVVASNSNGQFRLDEMQIAAPAAPQISFEIMPTGTSQKRLIARSRTLYLKDDLSGPLPTASVESLALPYEVYKMVFTPGLLNNVYSAKITISALQTILQNEGGYRNIDSDGVWWIPSGRLFFSADPKTPDASFAKSHFYLPQGFIDPFGNISTVQYDSYILSVQQAQDALQNTIVAQQQYRVMQPWLVTDPNQNRSGVRFDALGRVTATAAMGKQGLNEGDILDLTTMESSSKDDPTARIEYNLQNWIANSSPTFVHTFVRELHGAANPRWQEAYSYSDGSGHEVLKKIQAEPGPAPDRDALGVLQRDTSGNLIFAATTTRWVCSGRIVLDNKGNPVKKYEPFFDSSPVYETEKDLVQWGVTPILTYDPLGRLIRTDFPDGTLSRVEFDPWQTITWDQNDTVLESQWHATRQLLPSNDSQRDADDKAVAHANTPSVATMDSLGRTVISIADNGPAGKYQSHIELDIQSHQLSETDALGRELITYAYDMLGNRLHQSSIDAGDKWALTDIHGKVIRGWNGRGFQIRYTYDAGRRPAQLFVQPQGLAEFLAEYTVYGEGVTSAATHNRRTRVYQIYDAAGVATNIDFDFKGNLLSSSRQLDNQFQQTMDWSALAALTDPQQIVTAAKSLLQAEIFTSSTTYDALNRPLTITIPDASVIHPTFNDANLLETVSLNLRGAALTTVVSGIDYNARAQRSQIVYGNGSQTAYSYDSETFRLTDLKTIRSSDSAVQDLAYAYDPVGNITAISDSAQQTIYFKNAVVSAANGYTYDAIYRLLSATGRENIGQLSQPQNTWDDMLRINQPLPTDGAAMRNYTENYSYDAVGNILQMVHQATGGNWTRGYAYDEPNSPPTNNRLTSNIIGTTKEQFTYDASGNMLQMQHLPQITWDFKDQLHSTQQQVVNNGSAETTFYVYDSSGQRVRKVTATSNGIRSTERIYLGGFELYREYSGGTTVSLERQTLRVIDDKRCVALIETKTIDAAIAGSTVSSSVFRFQFDNHLGSACLELDDSAAIISYEEYYPYGSTSFEAVSSTIQVSAKRYRYTGKERDDETGFNYHGARYYAPWLGRWTSADPAGPIEFGNSFTYARCQPISLTDSTGTQTDQEPTIVDLSAEHRVTYSPQGASLTGPVIHPGAGLTYGTTPRQPNSSPKKQTPAPAKKKEKEFEPEVSDPEALRSAEGRGHIEGGDIAQFFKGLWNGPSSWVGGPQADVDPHYAGAAEMGKELGKNLVIEAVTAGVGKVFDLVRPTEAAADATKTVSTTSRVAAESAPAAKAVQPPAPNIVSNIAGNPAPNGATYYNLQMQRYGGVLGKLGLSKPVFNPVIEVLANPRGSSVAQVASHEAAHASDMLNFPQLSYFARFSKLPGRGLAAYVFEARGYFAEFGRQGVSAMYVLNSLNDTEKLYLGLEIGALDMSAKGFLGYGAYKLGTSKH